MKELEKFKNIFEGLDCAYGITKKSSHFDERGKNKTESFTIPKPPIQSLWNDHLEGKDRLPNGNYIQTSAQWFVIVSDDKGSETVMMSFYGSQLPVSRKWNAAQMSISFDGKDGAYTPARFSHIWKLSTIEKSGKGNTWYVYKYELVRKLDPAKEGNIYNRAKQFKANCKARTKNRKENLS